MSYDKEYEKNSDESPEDSIVSSLNDIRDQIASLTIPQEMTVDKLKDHREQMLKDFSKDMGVPVKMGLQEPPKSSALVKAQQKILVDAYRKQFPKSKLFVKPELDPEERFADPEMAWHMLVGIAKKEGVEFENPGEVRQAFFEIIKDAKVKIKDLEPWLIEVLREYVDAWLPQPPTPLENYLKSLR